jgi:hypothetical protein
MEQIACQKVFQIFYDSITMENNDKGFLQLDNSSNERPDWAEYWPIRNYFLKENPQEAAYYGFFSPKFKQKTGLDSSDVFDFINGTDADVILFPPFFDLSAMLLNIFSQHPQNVDYEKTFATLGYDVNLKQLVMTSQNTVFCNYFIAKSHVWLSWLAICDRLFSLCEDNDSEVSQHLISQIEYDGKNMQPKVFVVERMISFLLAINKQWTVKVFDPIKLPLANHINHRFLNQLIELDALKIAYDKTFRSEYINLFYSKRLKILY